VGRHIDDQYIGSQSLDHPNCVRAAIDFPDDAELGLPIQELTEMAPVDRCRVGENDSDRPRGPSPIQLAARISDPRVAGHVSQFRAVGEPRPALHDRFGLAGRAHAFDLLESEHSARVAREKKAAPLVVQTQLL
jgi:hypothetical protein